MMKHKHDGGFVAMSIGAGLLIVLAMAGMAARYMGDYLKAREWQVVAMQTNRFTQATSSYVGRYYPTVLAAATTTKPVVVTAQMLKNTGMLPATFSETNSYGQQYQSLIVRNPQNQELLQGMVVSRGGHAMPFPALSQISKEITAGFGGYVQDGKTAIGAMRSWRIALSSYGTSSGSGHLAVLLSTEDLSGAREDGDRLYRFQVNGRPDLNKMHTAIDMGGNNLNNVGTLNANTVAAQRGNFGVSLVSNGPITAGGDIRSTGGWIVSRSGKGWMDETHGGGLYMSDNDWLRILNNKGLFTGGQIRGGQLRSDGNVSVAGVMELEKINVAGTHCDKDGSVSRTAPGAPLSCQSGRWQANSKFDGRYDYIGSFQYSYSAVNRSDKAIMVYASGGASILNKKVKDGDNCSNTWALAGQVNGSSVTEAGSANSNWSKSGSISFLVPSGSTWTVISDPLPSYGCSPGSFSVNVFTLS
ncbi:shufflon system plasmid conjugative transfer pilus tip adhesin PilV [Salmonella enterica]|nr:shufflon system plasmid conjugative transfer pilus tip adhesin PilV [Salmonella enterica]EBS7181737.1 shufflon system plasmid conjugative transfer pilus tip adhesin PilV [Salmonella enterica]ECR8548481.1 shufflon system plasmid conjugative transfer pilus tip adhesin PilV [Salmonella enterica]EDQ5070633.1 shufflon system plasmid conjugative transfer pilus tip adhesin PilV [Salmonella enterica]EEA0369819.1 shufflon system plasmid conjugative transfer pilus tip adhesin PilV [Salmonella enterica